MENVFGVGNGVNGFYGFYGEGGGFAASIYGAMPKNSIQVPSHLRLLSYLRKVMTKLCIKILVKSDSAI